MNEDAQASEESHSPFGHSQEPVLSTDSVSPFDAR